MACYYLHTRLTENDNFHVSDIWLLPDGIFPLNQRVWMVLGRIVTSSFLDRKENFRVKNVTAESYTKKSNKICHIFHGSSSNYHIIFRLNFPLRWLYVQISNCVTTHISFPRTNITLINRNQITLNSPFIVKFPASTLLVIHSSCLSFLKTDYFQIYNKSRPSKDFQCT